MQFLASQQLYNFIKKSKKIRKKLFAVLIRLTVTKLSRKSFDQNLVAFFSLILKMIYKYNYPFEKHVSVDFVFAVFENIRFGLKNDFLFFKNRIFINLLFLKFFLI